MAKLMQRMATTSGAGAERLGLTLIRLVVGAVFIMHGYQKVSNMEATISTFHNKLGFGTNANMAAWAAAIAELGCGCLLALGLFTRLAAIPIIVVMAVAVMQVHLPHGFFAQNMGYEYALTLGVCALGLLLAGPGTLAADNFLGGKK